MIKKILSNSFDSVKYVIQRMLPSFMFLCVFCFYSTVILAQERGVATDASNGPDSSRIENRQNNPPSNREKINNFIQSAEFELKRKNVIAASLSQSFNIFDQNIQGNGAYLEKEEGANRMLRMEMNYVSGDARFDILFVSDGRKFWMSKDAGAGRIVTFIDLFMLHPQNCIEDVNLTKSTMQGNPFSPTNPQNALGGLSHLLSQMFRYFEFTDLTEAASPIIGQQLYQLSGTWKPDTFPFQEAVKQGVIQWDKVPEEIPNQINIGFGVNDLFPYKIVYTRKIQNETALISLIQFSDVSFSTRISSEQFRFEPPVEIMPIDKTPQYRQRQMQQKGKTSDLNDYSEQEGQEGQQSPQTYKTPDPDVQPIIQTGDQP